MKSISSCRSARGTFLISTVGKGNERPRATYEESKENISQISGCTCSHDEIELIDEKRESSRHEAGFVSFRFGFVSFSRVPFFASKPIVVFLVLVLVLVLPYPIGLPNWTRTMDSS